MSQPQRSVQPDEFVLFSEDVLELQRRLERTLTTQVVGEMRRLGELLRQDLRAELAGIQPPLLAKELAPGPSLHSGGPVAIGTAGGGAQPLRPDAHTAGLAMNSKGAAETGARAASTPRAAVAPPVPPSHCWALGGAGGGSAARGDCGADEADADAVVSGVLAGMGIAETEYDAAEVAQRDLRLGDEEGEVARALRVAATTRGPALPLAAQEAAPGCLLPGAFPQHPDGPEDMAAASASDKPARTDAIAATHEEPGCPLRTTACGADWPAGCADKTAAAAELRSSEVVTHSVEAPIRRGALYMKTSSARRVLPFKSSEGTTRTTSSTASTRFGSLLRLAPRMKKERSGLVTVNSTILRQARDLVSHKDTGLIARIVGSEKFDYCLCFMLLSNALLMGIQVDWQARHFTEQEDPFFRVVEVFFCVVFTVELALRLGAYGRGFFVGPGLGWNWFDLTLVVMQLAEELASAAVGDGAIQKAGTSVQVMRLLRILRLLRVARVLRLVRFVSELRKIVYLIWAAFWSFIWTAVLLTMLTYIVGVFFTEVVMDQALNNSDSVPRDSALVTTYFGGIQQAMVTLFGVATGGIGWVDIYDNLDAQISQALGLIFILYVGFAVLVLLNLVTGVFVDGAMKLTKEDKQQELLKKVRRAFGQVESASGDITWQSFSESFVSPEMHDVFKAIEINMAKAEDLFQFFDHDGNGGVSPEEFAIGAVNLQGPARALDVAMLSVQTRNQVDSLQETISRLEAFLYGVGRASACSGSGSEPTGCYRSVCSRSERGSLPSAGARGSLFSEA